MIFSTFNNGALDATKNLKIFKATLEDYKNVYKSTYEENRSSGKTKIGSFFRGNKAAIGYATNGISESDIQALKDYNAQLDLGVSKQTAFYRTLSDPSVSDNARRIAESAKYGKVNIDNLAKSNDVLSKSYKNAAVEATLFNVAITMGITFAISKVIELINWLSTLHDTNQKNIEQQAETAKQRVSNIDSELKSIKDLTAKYKELASKSNLDFDSKLEIKDIQNQITKLVGNQADNLDLVNGKLEEELSKLNKIYHLQESNTTSAYRNAYGTAIRNVEAGQYGDWNWIQKIANDLSGTGDSGIFIKDAYKESTFNNTVKLINDTFEQLGVEDAKAIATFNDFTLRLPEKIGDRINVLDAAIKAMESQPDYQDNKIYQKLNDFRDEMYGKISGAQKAIIDLLDRVEKDDINPNDAYDIKSLDDYIEYRDKVVKKISNDTDVKDAIDKGLISEDTIQKRVDAYLSTLEGFSDYYQQWQSQNKSTTDSVVNQVNRFKELMEEKGTDKDPSFVENIEKTIEKFQKLEDALVKFESGTLKDNEKISLFKTFPQLTAYADNLATGIRNLLSEMRTDVVSNFTEQLNTFKKAGATQEEIAQLEAYENTVLKIADAVDSTNNVLDSMRNVFKDLDSIIKDYNENSYFSLDSLEKLANSGQRYLSYLSYENGQLKINEEAYKKLVLAQIDEIETKATLQATTDLQSLTDETSAKEYLAKVNIDLAQSQLTAAQAAFQYQLALKVAEGGKVAEAAQRVAENLNTLRNIFATARTQVDSYSAAMLGATSATEKKAKASEKAKSALESEQRALEHSKKALEDQKQALEETKDEYEKAQKAIEDLVKWTENYIKQINEDTIKALEKERDKRNELIELRIKEIEKAKELHDTENELGEKINTVAKARLKAASTSLDESSAGKKATKIALEESKKADKEYQDFLYEQRINSQLESLEEQKANNENFYEEQITKIQDYLDNEVQLYRDACAMIDNDNGTLYNKLLNYALTYTTTGKTEFDLMWTMAQNAMERYNVANIGTMQFLDELKGRMNDVDLAIENISKNIEAYEDRIDSVKNKLDDLKDAAVQAKNAIDKANSTPLTPQAQANLQSKPQQSSQQSSQSQRYLYTGTNGQTYMVTAKSLEEAVSYFSKNIKSPFLLDTDKNRIRANIRKYATGTRSTPSAFISQEKGLEAIFAKNPNGSGSYTLTTPESQVFDHKRTDNLYDFSGNPEEYLRRIIERGLTPLSSEELAGLGLNTVVDLSQAKTQGFNFPDLADKIKNGVVDNSVGNIGSQDNSQNININNVFNGDVTPQMLRLLEQKEREIVAKATKASHNDFIETTLKGRKWR